MRFQFEQWAFQNIGQFTRSGYYSTNGRWVYTNHNIQNLAWDCWQACVKAKEEGME